MIVRTEAITLRGVNFGETSQIVTLYTKEMGTIAVMARGARSGKSKFGSALQPMSHFQAVLYYKESREVHSLSEATLLSVFRRIPRDINKMSTGLRIVESLKALMPSPESNEFAFETVLEVLQRLDQSEEQWQNLFPYFELQLSAALGFAPSVDKAQIESITPSGGFLRLDDGSAVTNKPDGPATSISRPAIRAIGVMLHSNIDTVLRMNVPQPLLDEIGLVVEAYLSYHVEGFRQSRSKRVFENMRVNLSR